MPKKLLLIFFLLSSFAVFSQKKTKQAKVVHAAHSVGVASLTRISPERKLRLSQREEAKKSLVVLKNMQQLLPLCRLDTLKIVVVSMGMGENNPLPKFIGRYVKADYLTIGANSNPESIRRKLADSAQGYNLVIVAVAERNNGGAAPSENSVNTDSAGLAGQFFPDTSAAGAKTIFMLYGSPQFLALWENIDRASAILATGKTDYDRMDLSAQLLFGAISATGKLSFALNKYKKGDGISFQATGRLGYVLPEELGIDSVRLSQKMDSLVGIGIKEKAFPGCQLLLAKNGKVMYQKSYGFYTYDHSQPVEDDDLYDLASVTKVLAPVPALMMLADQKKFLVTKKMSDYWPDWKGSNKEGILVSDLLSHQARLRPGVTLWPKTVDENGKYKSEYYTLQPKPGYELRVSGNLYLIDSYPDTIYKVIRDSPLLRSKKYAYSDLGFVIMPKLIENLSGEAYQTFLFNRLYARLGASTLMYRPYLSEPKEKIVPTEDDQVFRNELLQGFVHDETAALMGGVSGNAGLFGSAGDVAKVMQLYLQNGIYGNERYISSETLKIWTSSHFQKTNNRRGFGFDKPGIQMNRHTGKESYPSKVVSEQSYGHSGYTGTFVWADPAKELLLVFLSNRVFPDRNNHKINKLRIRPLLLESLYKLAGEPSKGR